MFRTGAKRTRAAAESRDVHRERADRLRIEYPLAVHHAGPEGRVQPLQQEGATDSRTPPPGFEGQSGLLPIHCRLLRLREVRFAGNSFLSAASLIECAQQEANGA